MGSEQLGGCVYPQGSSVQTGPLSAAGLSDTHSRAGLSKRESRVVSWRTKIVIQELVADRVLNLRLIILNLQTKS